MNVVAAGGAGGTSGFVGQGGAGAQVTGDVAVTPGATLFVEVGVGGAPPYFNGFGGGGGESDVRTCSVNDATCPVLGTRRIRA